LTARRFRFERRAARAQWYLSPWLTGTIALGLVGLVFMMGVERSIVAWLVCAGLVALLAYRAWQMVRYVARFWEQKRALVVWIDGGSLHAESNGARLESQSLSDVRTVDALEVGGRLVRLLVDTADGERTIYAGLDDMEAFATAFRLNTPGARYRRVRMGFPMTLREV
jgi:hypothetical protein